MKIKLLIAAMLSIGLLAGCGDSDDGTTPVSPPVSPPDVPTGLAVTATGLTSLTLAWDATSDATSYTLYRALYRSGAYSEVYSGAATEFVDVDLDYATFYEYQVCAENSAGESDRSAAVSGTTDTPLGFTVTGSPSGSVDYTFNYLDDFNGAPRYQSDPIGLWILVPSSGPQQGNWVFYDQIEGMNLYYYPETGTSDFPPQTGWRRVYDDAQTSRPTRS
ncbi:MAG: fibronectin type III domain-containing protein [bacterium]